MRILVTGASGFIGSHIVKALTQSGVQAVCAVRNAGGGAPDGKDSARFAGSEVIEAGFGRDSTSAQWQEILVKHNIDAVINAAGIIRERHPGDFELVHTAGPIALFDACEAAGLKLVIQISALGADDHAESRFHLSKRAADDHLRSLQLDSVIIQPSIVYGPGEGSMTLFKRLAALPLLPVIGSGDQQVQPIHVEDLAAGVANMVNATEYQDGNSGTRTAGGARTALTIPAVSPRPVSFSGLLKTLRSWLGLRPAPVVRLPLPVMRAVARAGDIVGAGPITSESLAMLQRGNTADPKLFAAATGVSPRTIEESFPPGEASVSERREIRLAPLVPILRISIAFIWLATGVVSAFIYPLAASFQMLSQTPLPPETWAAVIYGTSGFEILLGAATLLRFKVRAVCLIQIALILGFTVIITASLPEFWIQPFGPVTKNIPIIAATLVLMVLDDS